MTTLKEIETCSKEMLLVSDIAPIFSTDPQSIRVQAHEDPRKLGFPVVVIGTRVLIPREGFLAYCRARYMEAPV